MYSLRRRLNSLFSIFTFPLLAGQFFSSFSSLLFALYLFTSADTVYASNIAKLLSLASVLASIIKLGSDNILVSRLRSTRNFAFHSKLTLYASSYFIISFILSLLSVFATFFVPYIYSITSFYICLVSFGLVLLSYTSTF